MQGGSEGSLVVVPLRSVPSPGRISAVFANDINLLARLLGMRANHTSKCETLLFTSDPQLHATLSACRPFGNRALVLGQTFRAYRRACTLPRTTMYYMALIPDGP